MTTNNITKTWLTPAARDRLEAELTELRNVRIPAVEADLVEAQASAGALIDKGDLDAAFDERAILEARASQIERTLAHSVVRAAPTEISVAGVGTLVTVRDADGSEDTYLFSTPENKVPGHILLSPRSPMGQALLGQPAGTTFTYDTPGGVRKATLISVVPFNE